MTGSQEPPDSCEIKEAEALLARVRPLPSIEFVEATESRLIGRERAPLLRRERAALRIRWRFAAAGLACGLAALAYVLGGFGGGPLSVTGDDVRARDTCSGRTVQTSPSLAALELRDGRVAVVPRSGSVTTAAEAPCP